MKKFYPDDISNTVYDIDFKFLFQEGRRGVIFDIDNTLVFHGAPANKEIIELFEYLREIGFKTMLLSNNKEKRVKDFAMQVKSPYIFKAAKPSTKNYIKAMKQMKTTKDTTYFIGDQLFTDVWGGKRAGIRTCLVKPLNPKEEIQIVLKRYLEKIVLASFYKQREDERNHEH